MSDDEVSFGYQGFWPTAYGAFPKFWEVYPRLLEALDSLTARAYKDVGPLQKVIINLGIVAGTSLSEICVLVGNGLGPGAMKIARSLLECAINAEFLRLFPQELDDYLDWSFVEQHKLMRFVRKDAPHLLPKLSQEIVDRLEGEFASVRSRFEFVPKDGKPRLRESWSSTRLDVRASRSEFEEAYRLIYPMGNKLMHASISGLALHVDGDLNLGTRISPPPSLTMCSLALVGAHMCVARMVETVSKTVGEEPSPPIAKLVEDYNYAWVATPQEYS